MLRNFTVCFIFLQIFKLAWHFHQSTMASFLRHAHTARFATCCLWVVLRVKEKEKKDFKKWLEVQRRLLASWADWGRWMRGVIIFSLQASGISTSVMKVEKQWRSCRWFSLSAQSFCWIVPLRYFLVGVMTHPLSYGTCALKFVLPECKSKLFFHLCVLYKHFWVFFIKESKVELLLYKVEEHVGFVLKGRNRWWRIDFWISHLDIKKLALTTDNLGRFNDPNWNVCSAAAAKGKELSRRQNDKLNLIAPKSK